MRNKFSLQSNSFTWYTIWSNVHKESQPFLCDFIFSSWLLCQGILLVSHAYNKESVFFVSFSVHVLDQSCPSQANPYGGASAASWLWKSSGDVRYSFRRHASYHAQEEGTLKEGQPLWSFMCFYLLQLSYLSFDQFISFCDISNIFNPVDKDAGYFPGKTKPWLSPQNFIE